MDEKTTRKQLSKRYNSPNGHTNVPYFCLYYSTIIRLKHPEFSKKQLIF